ncbi:MULTISPECIES: hypothetical protein [Streptomyces]|uniref:hypothetical protein n=1 Tax=Streptomyces TaxID=1883 RepID=UPI0004C1FCFE|nr:MULTISPECIES: hypothetical protein [Streptomyces]THA33692.1 hypothetical protein E6W17_30775 [Streptomyces sp. A1547]
MSDLDWSWEYEPDEAHVTTGLAVSVIAEAEQVLADLVELAAMGVDPTTTGRGPADGGVRRIDLPSGGWMYVLPIPRRRTLYVTAVMPPFHLL